MAERVIETEVLIVGGGGGGFRAAIGARERGAKALILSKGPLARCGATPMAGADFTLDGRSLNDFGYTGDLNDTKEAVFNDIVTQGFYMNNQKLVEQYIQTAPDRLRELIDWGIKIRNSEQRAIYTTGIEIMDALYRKARTVGVDMLEDTMMIDVLTQDGKITGGLGLDIMSGELIHFKTKALVMATGGWHKAFWPNTGMRDLSGEGIAMANRAGADIGNMEFITFCCNVLYEPPTCLGSIATYIIGNRWPVQLTNSAGETFLEKYDPFTVQKGTTMEWNKSFVSFASMREVRSQKGSPGGGIYFGLGDLPWEEFDNKATSIFPNWRYKALDLSEIARKLKEKEPVEVGPAVEYFDGGILINEHFETGVEGLFAAGECTVGPFGANRIFSAITEMLVHGAAAGRNAGIYASRTKSFRSNTKAFRSLREMSEGPLMRKQGVKPAQLRRRVQEMAHKYLGPIRSREELLEFITFLENVKNDELPNLEVNSKSRIYNREWIDALELGNMVHLLEAAARSALFRTESRGVHYREDYPCTDNDNWLRETVVKFERGTLTVSNRPVIATSLSLPSGVVPFLTMLKKMMASHSEIGGHH